MQLEENKKVNGKGIVDEFFSKVAEGSEHIIDVARKVVDDKEQVTFALQKRQLQPEQVKSPIRKESPRRAHILYSIESFVDYLVKNKTDNTVVLANVNESKITAILDEKAVNGFETISFTPQIHPLFAPWQSKVIGKSIEIEDFAIFLQQNKKSILSPTAKDLTMFFSQVRASQKITMHKGVGNKSINGLTCELSIMGKNQNEEVELPESIKLNVPIYIDTDKQEIEVDIILSAKDTDVFVNCSSSELDVHKVKAFGDMISKVRGIDNLIVGFGACNTEEWAYLR